MPQLVPFYFLNQANVNGFNHIIICIMLFASVLCGIFFLYGKNPIVFALFLISLLFDLATYLIMLGVNSTSFTYLLMYAGGSLILLWSVVMLINVGLSESNNHIICIITYHVFTFILISTCIKVPFYLGLHNLDAMFIYPLVTAVSACLSYAILKFFRAKDISFADAFYIGVISLIGSFVLSVIFFNIDLYGILVSFLPEISVGLVCLSDESTMFSVGGNGSNTNPGSSTNPGSNTNSGSRSGSGDNSHTIQPMLSLWQYIDDLNSTRDRINFDISSMNQIQANHGIRVQMNLIHGRLDLQVPASMTLQQKTALTQQVMGIDHAFTRHCTDFETLLNKGWRIRRDVQGVPSSTISSTIKQSYLSSLDGMPAELHNLRDRYSQAINI